MCELTPCHITQVIDDLRAHAICVGGVVDKITRLDGVVEVGRHVGGGNARDKKLWFTEARQN